ncbi:MAG: radical SAM protein [Candidatus Nitrosotalea sp.]|nr:radical SAM protein [Candidatus Nitrosotalea sp.]
MPVDVIRTINRVGKWSINRAVGKRRPIIGVFSLTHYCNYFCPMCPFGDSDKQGQMKIASKNDLTTDQWKQIFDKVSEYCIWCIVEGGEPTSRPDFMELIRYLHTLKMPITLITNCSLLHTIDIDELKKYVQFITCSIDSVFEESYCKVRGVTSQTYNRVMQNLEMLTEHQVPHFFNSVITKFNTKEFLDGSYFKRATEMGVDAVSLTFVEDRSDVNYSLLPDRNTINDICRTVLEHIKSKKDPQIMLPPQYFEQILDHGRGIFDECGVWKSIFVNGNGTVMVPCWKYNNPKNTYNLLEKNVGEIWDAPQWEIAKTCHDCQVLGCIWYSSQPTTTFAQNYMRGLSKMISRHSPEMSKNI